jgi:hypothetical protein
MTHYARAHSLARYAAEVSSVDADAKLLEVWYVGCSPGQSVEWLTYSSNHDLAFLPMQAPAATSGHFTFRCNMRSRSAIPPRRQLHPTPGG